MKRRYGGLRSLVKTLLVLFLVLSSGSCVIYDLLFDDGKSGGSARGPDAVEPVPGWQNSRYDEVAIIKGAASVALPGARAGEQVFYVVTNYGVESRQVTTPGTGASASGVGPPGFEGERLSPISGLGASGTAVSSPVRDRARLIPGHPLIREEYEKAYRMLPARARTVRSSVSGSTFQPASFNIDDSKSFFAYIWDNGNLNRSSTAGTATTLKEIRQRDGWRALFWVAGNLYNGENDTALDDAVAGLANSFLGNGDNVIFPAVTTTFGLPWGEPGFSNIIAAGTRDIHVLVYDISDGGPGGLTVGGLFAPIDLFLNAQNDGVSTSNEKLMFYMNGAVLTGENNQADYIRTTLAHEFQHMIHFYQRGVRRGAAAAYPVWLDELASMTAEDLVASKINVANPAGIRMPDYNAWGALRELTTWPTSGTADTLPYYGTSYSFGAYLSRIYGAPLFQVLLQEIPLVASDLFSRDRTYDRWAVAEAVRRVSETESTFTELLRRWGVSMLVSHDQAVPAAVRINQGGTPFTSGVGAQTYALQSLNAHAYSFQYQDSGGNIQTYNGPSLFPHGIATLPPAANRFVYGGQVPAGGSSLSFNLPQDVVLTVLTYK